MHSALGYHYHWVMNQIVKFASNQFKALRAGRMSKEGILSITINTIDRAQPPACRGCNAYASESDSILRNSLFDILRFCGTLFSPAAGLKNGQFNHQKIVPFWRSFIRDVKGHRRIIAQQGIECMNRNRGGVGETIATCTWRNTKCKNLNF